MIFIAICTSALSNRSTDNNIQGVHGSTTEEMVKLLLDNKADVNAIDEYNKFNCMHMLAGKQKSKGKVLL